ncbi:unnamed protein product [Caenorhabditis sp. 36 PRJEB53466]|nr:unnamed protein product [Caenorhabditis sp. 36 PRJEB53466]
MTSSIGCPVQVSDIIDQISEGTRMRYDDSTLGRQSIVFRSNAFLRYFSTAMPPLDWANPQRIGQKCVEDGKKWLISDCQSNAGYSEDICNKVIDNGLWLFCEIEGGTALRCKGAKEQTVWAVNTSSPWFWAPLGVVTGVMIAAIVLAVIYCVCLQKKAPTGPASSGVTGKKPVSGIEYTTTRTESANATK